jgi:hypothetical protein
MRRTRFDQENPTAFAPVPAAGLVVVALQVYPALYVHAPAACHVSLFKPGPCGVTSVDASLTLLWVTAALAGSCMT